MRTLNHSDLLPYISAPRLNTYKNFFSTRNDIELLGAYQWGKELSASFFPLLQVFEITLRNSIHNEAKNHIANDWYDRLRTRNSNTLTESQKGHIRYLRSSINSAKRKLSRDNQPIDSDRVIAKVTFGFWTNLFSVAFDANGTPNALWPVLQKRVFPHSTKRERRRDNLHTLLLSMQDFRNKAFHHEPIWNIGHPSNITEAMSNIESRKKQIIDIIGWISSETKLFVIKSGYADNISRINSIEYLNYLMDPGASDVPYSRAKRELGALLRTPNQTIDITVNGSRKAKLIN